MFIMEFASNGKTLTFIIFNAVIVLFIGCLAFLLNMAFNAAIIIPLAMIVGLILSIIFVIPIMNWLSKD